MRPDADGRASVIRENLALLDVEAGSASERRLAQLYELAMLLLQESALFSSEGRCDVFNRLFEQPTRSAPSSIDAAQTYLRSTAENDLLLDKLTVCRLAAERLKQKRGFRLERLLGAEEDILLYNPSPRIAYLKNAYSDAAFRSFSTVLDAPTVDYVSDFTQVCEEVYYGRADMCILPIDSSRDAKLISFYRLIDKFELKLALSCDVPSADGSVTTRYVLLRKSLELPPESWFKSADAAFFEFSLVPDSTASLSDVLRAAEICGLSVHKLDAIPLTYIDNEFSYDIILKLGEQGCDSLALYLALAAPQITALGIYPHLG